MKFVPPDRNTLAFRFHAEFDGSYNQKLLPSIVNIGFEFFAIRKSNLPLSEPAVVLLAYASILAYVICDAEEFWPSKYSPPIGSKLLTVTVFTVFKDGTCIAKGDP